MPACGAFNNFILPLRAQLARVTFAAALVSKKVCQPLQHVAHVSAIVEDHNCAGAKRQASYAQVLERYKHLEIFLNGIGTRGPADERRPKLPARFEPAREIEQQMAQGDPKRHLVKSGPLNLPRYAKQLRAARPFSAQLAILRGAPLDDQGDVAESLDVVNDSRLAE